MKEIDRKIDRQIDRKIDRWIDIYTYMNRELYRLIDTARFIKPYRNPGQNCNGSL